MNQDLCAADFANTVNTFVNRYSTSSGKELSTLEMQRPAAYAQLDTTLFNARDPLGTRVHFVRNCDLLNLFRYNFDKVQWIYFQPVLDHAIAEEVTVSGSTSSLKGHTPPAFTNDFVGYSRFDNAISVAYSMLYN